MIRLNGSAASYGELWFDEAAPESPGVDILRYRCRSAPPAGARSVTAFLSMLTELNVEPDDIMAAFSKDCRYKIRRADTKDGLITEWFSDPQPGLAEFIAFFDAFARQKSHEPCDRQWLGAASAAGQLMLTRATRDGETLVWHAYLIAGNRAWLQYSASCFRDKDNDYRALVGRANRWLHWKSILHCKALGMTCYDWGGLFPDETEPEHAGINGFKRSFGGHIARTFNCTVPVTFKGRLYLPLRAAWRSGRTALPFRKASLASA